VPVGCVDDLGAERPPAHVRLDAAHEYEVAPALDGFSERDPRRRPRDPAAHTIDQRDRRPVDLEVVVVLRVDFSQALRRPREFEGLDRVGGRIGRVVPTLEGGDHDWTTQVRGCGELDHPEAPSVDGLLGAVAVPQAYGVTMPSSAQATRFEAYPVPLRE
jgi:hypothetical protein